MSTESQDVIHQIIYWLESRSACKSHKHLMRALSEKSQ